MKIVSIGVILFCSILSIKCQSPNPSLYNRDVVATPQEISFAAQKQKLGNRKPNPSLISSPYPSQPLYQQAVVFPNQQQQFPNQQQQFPNQQQNNEETLNLGELDAQKTGFFREIPKDRQNEDPRGYRAVTEFALNLFKASNNQNNFVLSPLSPQILLSYLAWVAEGETRNELVRGNGFGSPVNIQKLVNQMLSDGANRELQIATAFFVSQEMRLNEDFLQRSLKNADVVNVDFKSQEAASRTITRWAQSKTKGGLKINGLKFSPTTKIALTSAIYFKGKWVYTFQKAQPGIFNTPNGPSRVPMMFMKRKFKWGELGNYAQWAAMPYESENSMIIILPNEGQQIDQVIANLDENTLSSVISSAADDSSNADVTLTLPKFKLESTTSLVEPLQKMGIRTMFTPRAELPYLSDYDAVQVTNAQQQASIDVNEEGTVLIAFTNFNVVALSLQPIIPNVNFTVNRPFIAIIADHKWNVPLVIAKITNPLQ